MYPCRYDRPCTCRGRVRDGAGRGRASRAHGAKGRQLAKGKLPNRPVERWYFQRHIMLNRARAMLERLAYFGWLALTTASLCALILSLTLAISGSGLELLLGGLG